MIVAATKSTLIKFTDIPIITFYSFNIDGKLKRAKQYYNYRKLLKLHCCCSITRSNRTFHIHIYCILGQCIYNREPLLGESDRAIFNNEYDSSNWT